VVDGGTIAKADGPGQIVILNGAPRSGKSSIVAAMQETLPGPWMNLGVDVFARRVTPPRYQPGLGLRPGGERPDLEDLLPALNAAFYDSVAAHSRQGLNVVVDIGHHDHYTRPLRLLADAARRLGGLPVLLVGVRCPLGLIMRRRARTGLLPAGPDGRPDQSSAPPRPVVLWQEAVHVPGLYDLEVDTAVLSPKECAERIGQRLRHGPPGGALQRLAQGT
jgi:chloramphenicol 3-O phosphotransferase